MTIFSWRLSVGMALSAATLYLPVLLARSFDFLGIAYIFVLLPVLTILVFVVGLVLAFSKRRVNWRLIVGAAVTYWSISILLFVLTPTLRPHLRWLLQSGEFKAQVLAQPRGLPGELRHIEWDGWGGFGADTNVYLVYDEQDAIGPFLRTRNRGRFPGIPCEVAGVRRLSPKWYSVVFYTDYTWKDCHS